MQAILELVWHNAACSLGIHVPGILVFPFDACLYIHINTPIDTYIIYIIINHISDFKTKYDIKWIIINNMISNDSAWAA